MCIEYVCLCVYVYIFLIVVKNICKMKFPILIIFKYIKFHVFRIYKNVYINTIYM